MSFWEYCLAQSPSNKTLFLLLVGSWCSLRQLDSSNNLATWLIVTRSLSFDTVSLIWSHYSITLKCWVSGGKCLGWFLTAGPNTGADNTGRTDSFLSNKRRGSTTYETLIELGQSPLQSVPLMFIIFQPETLFTIGTVIPTSYVLLCLYITLESNSFFDNT